MGTILTSFGPQPVKFGKKPVRFDKRTLRFQDYLTPSLPLPPSRVLWTKGFNINFGMMLNDTLGDCVEAAKGHALQTLTMDNGRLITVPDSVILQNYEANAGYVPGDPSTDGGEDMLSSMNAWRKAPKGFGGFALDGYASLNLSNFEHIAQCIWLLGGAYSGFNVPQSALDQNSAGQIWSVVPNDGGIQGGHCVWVAGYDAAKQMLLVITWGMVQWLTWPFWVKYFDESYALRVPAWLNARGTAPSGFLDSQWDADVTAIAA